MALRDYTSGGDGSGKINIDEVLDVFHGVVQETSHEQTKEGEPEQPEGQGGCDLTECGSKCTKCHNSCNSNKENEYKKKSFDWDTYLYGPLESDDDEDDNHYICEYCTKIGSSEKYDPDMCDECGECEQCQEYGEECDGCSFSCHRDGQCYRDKLGLDELLSENDMNLISSAKETFETRDGSTRGLDFVFTVLDI